MTSLFDSHNHFFNSPDMGQSLSVCKSSGLEFMSICSIEEKDWSTVSLLAEQYHNIFPQFGLHPWFVENTMEGWEERLTQFLYRFPNAGVGECGLDKSDRRKGTIDKQMVIFRSHLNIAKKFNRPLSIHCVKAWLELFDVLGNYKNRVTGLIHSFSGSPETAEQLVKAGFYISFSPFILKNCSHKTKEAIRTVPLDRLLIETDSPDTRVINNEFSTPAGLKLVLEFVTDIRDESLEIIAASTCGNAKRIFAL